MNPKRRVKNLLNFVSIIRDLSAQFALIQISFALNVSFSSPTFRAILFTSQYKSSFTEQNFLPIRQIDRQNLMITKPKHLQKKKVLFLLFFCKTLIIKNKFFFSSLLEEKIIRKKDQNDNNLPIHVLIVFG